MQMQYFYNQITVGNNAPETALIDKFDSFDTALNLYYRIVLFVVKKANLIQENWREQFYRYLISCVNICGGSVDAIGGSSDRVQMLVAVRPTKALADFLSELKLLSQTWMRRKMKLSEFAWQERTRVFTVSAAERERVKADIERHNSIVKQIGAAAIKMPIYRDENCRDSETDFYFD